jgi:methanethiol S-methyltransferase
MVAWSNVILMLLTALVSGYFYCKSAGPAALEKTIGENAYKKCSGFRFVSLVLMIIHVIQYGVYFFYPIDSAIPATFPWSWWISVAIAAALAGPSSLLLHKAARYAGMEPVVTKKNHKLFRGIYNKIRHPIAVAELPIIWSFAFLLNSPFLALFSIIWVPLFYLMCVTEEKDLEIRYGQAYMQYKNNTGMFFPKRRKK